MLETARLRLRPMQATDVDDLLAIFADPKVMASFDHMLFDHAAMTRWVQRNLDHQARYGYGLFAVTLKANGRLIGDCGLERMDTPDLVQAELGYDFRSDYWGQGFATEAAVAIRDYAFAQLKLPRLISLIRAGNHASARVALKVGMQRQADLAQGDLVYWVYSQDQPVTMPQHTNTHPPS